MQAMKNRAMLVCAASALLAFGCTSEKHTVGFAVDGMACANCANEVAHTLEGVPGVKHARVDFQRKWATVSLDPQRPASMGALQSAVSDWRKEHMGAEEDPQCLDPQARKALQEKGTGK